MLNSSRLLTSPSDDIRRKKKLAAMQQQPKKPMTMAEKLNDVDSRMNRSMYV
jgi:hypothetical protein